jgi:hypothetical protein
MEKKTVHSIYHFLPRILADKNGKISYLHVSLVTEHGSGGTISSPRWRMFVLPIGFTARNEPFRITAGVHFF